MNLILLEALGALVLLLGIVWWTMFAGRHRGELDEAAAKHLPVESPAEKASDDTPSSR